MIQPPPETQLNDVARTEKKGGEKVNELGKSLNRFVADQGKSRKGSKAENQKTEVTLPGFKNDTELKGVRG